MNGPGSGEGRRGGGCEPGRGGKGRSGRTRAKPGPLGGKGEAAAIGGFDGWVKIK